MAKSHAEIEGIAGKMLEEAGIQPCFKPSVPKLVAAAGLKVALATDLQDSILSTLLLRPSEEDKLEKRQDNVIFVNANKNDKEQRFSIAYQVAAYMLNKDGTERFEKRLTSREVDVKDDILRLAYALLMNDKLFTDKFNKAMKGIPNKVAICKNLGSQFGVPQYAVEQRAAELDLSF